MTAARSGWPAQLLHYWFHQLRPDQWFGRSDEVDAQLDRRFGSTLAVLANRPAREFLRDPLTARAAVLLFDQLPRNLHRGTPQAFASDPLARAILKGARARGWDRGLGKSACQFLYLPLMHSEAIADQRLAMRLLPRLGDPWITAFAGAHYRMIARYGHFPHRNAIFGRTSSPAEQCAIASGNTW